MDELLQNALYAALDPLTDAPIWWTVTDDSTLPRAIMQLQSDINTRHRINHPGSSALVTIKAQGRDLASARAVRDALCPLSASGIPTLPSLTIDGYTVTSTYVRTPILPFDGLVYQAGHIFRIVISRN